MVRPRRVSDEAIDEAARAVFLEHGVDAPVTMVAARLGVSHAAVLQRTGGKEALMARALAQEVPAALVTLEAAPPTRGVRRALVRLLMELHGSLARSIPALVVQRAAGRRASTPDGRLAPTVALRRALASWLSRSTRVRPARAPAIADALLGAMEARCFNAFLGDDSFVEGETEPYIRGLVAALVPAKSPARHQGATSPARRQGAT
jgi:AcrR family transcriptional regulator